MAESPRPAPGAGLPFTRISLLLAYDAAHMLEWSLLFLIIALIAGLFGFGVVATAAVDIARILFFVFITLFILSAAFSFFR